MVLGDDYPQREFAQQDLLEECKTLSIIMNKGNGHCNEISRKKVKIDTIYSPLK